MPLTGLSYNKYCEVAFISTTRDSIKMTRRRLFYLLAWMVSMAGLSATAHADAVTDTFYYRGRLVIDSNNSLLLTLTVVQQDDTTMAWLGSPDQTDRLTPATKLYLAGDSISVNFKSLNARIRGRFADVAGERYAEKHTLRGKFLQGLLARSIEMVRYDGGSPYHRPQMPQPPFPYLSQEVTFRNPQTPYLFHGTLTYPQDNGAQRRYPAVILVSGSGASDRDETIFGHKPFAVLADYLTRQGIVVLRYDDRGWGSEDTNLYAGTTADFADDARCAVQALRQQPMVDTSRVGIIGHSEGGLIAQMLAADGTVNFAVMLAAPFVSGKEILLSQSQYILECQGYTKEQIKENAATLLRMAQRTGSMSERWVNYFYHYDPKPLHKAIKQRRVPLLVLQGGKDCQVLWQLNLKPVQRRLVYPGVAIHFYDDLNHLFQRCTTGLPGEYPLIEETLYPQVLQDIATFIHDLGR